MPLSTSASTLLEMFSHHSERIPIVGPTLKRRASYFRFVLQEDLTNSSPTFGNEAENAFQARQEAYLDQLLFDTTQLLTSPDNQVPSGHAQTMTLQDKVTLSATSRPQLSRLSQSPPPPYSPKTSTSSPSRSSPVSHAQKVRKSKSTPLLAKLANDTATPRPWPVSMDFSESKQPSSIGLSQGFTPTRLSKLGYARLVASWQSIQDVFKDTPSEKKDISPADEKERELEHIWSLAVIATNAADMGLDEVSADLWWRLIEHSLERIPGVADNRIEQERMKQQLSNMLAARGMTLPPPNNPNATPWPSLSSFLLPVKSLFELLQVAAGVPVANYAIAKVQNKLWSASESSQDSQLIEQRHVAWAQKRKVWGDACVNAAVQGAVWIKQSNVPEGVSQVLSHAHDVSKQYHLPQLFAMMLSQCLALLLWFEDQFEVSRWFVWISGVSLRCLIGVGRVLLS